MSLDRYMGNPPKKETKKKSKKEKTIEKVDKKTNSKSETQSNTQPQVEQITRFTFITKKYRCPTCVKPKYEKTIKRPYTFTPKPDDLICPKCGSQLKQTKK